MKKCVLIVAMLAAVTMVLSGFTTKQPQLRQKAAPTQAPSAMKPQASEKMAIAREAAVWTQAQAWLKSIGYDLTFDQMKTLKKLNLQKYSVETASLITDENMRHVALLTNLEILPVHRNIGDAGLRYFVNLKKLRVLVLSMTKVTENGLQYLHNLTNLEQLNLDGLPITDAGLAGIKHLHPAILTLNNTPITDAGITDFLQGRSMQYISLSRTDLTDAAVPALANMQWVGRIDIQGTKISEQGYQQLRAAHPQAQIYYRPNGIANS